MLECGKPVYRQGHVLRVGRLRGFRAWIDADHLELDSFAVEAFGARGRRASAPSLRAYAELYHYEFTSRGREEANEEKLRRWKREQALFIQRWPEFFLTGDPWLGPNLSAESEYFSL